MLHVEVSPMYKYALILMLIILLSLAGCAGSSCKVDYRTALPLNEGTIDVSFLSGDEIKVLEDINARRTGSGTEPLKLSKGLSSSSKLRALELTRSGREDALTEQNSDGLLQRLNRYGKPVGSFAEMLSYGYTIDAIVPEFMEGADPSENSDVYFMERVFTAAGVACVPGHLPGPTCVITLASQFVEG